MSKISQDKLKRSLPFDQYSRQLIVSRLIDNSVRLDNPNQKLQIIDLGGHKGKTHAFQPNDNVTVLDVFNESYEGYIKGDATNTDFSDNSFDIAVSFDVFEHIPRDKRKAFLSEALRISKFGVFLAMPIDFQGKVAGAEVLLNDFYKITSKKEHPWLKEHIEYRIPNDQEIKKLVMNQGAEMVSIATNQVGDWQLMQMLIFAAADNADITNDVTKANIWYNEHIDKLDSNVDFGYRKVYFVSKNKQHIKKVENAINNFTRKPTGDDYVTVHRDAFDVFARTLASISRKYSRMNKEHLKVASMENELESLRNNMNMASSHISSLTEELDKVYSSVSWKVSKPLRHAGKVRRKLNRSTGDE